MDSETDSIGFTPPGEPLDPVTTVLRTPELRFAGLPDFPFRAHCYETDSISLLRCLSRCCLVRSLD